MSGAAFLATSSLNRVSGMNRASNPIRLGGPVFSDYEDPDQWVEAVRHLGYTAAYCPVDADADNETVRAYETAAGKANIIIAEVGVWNNMIHPDEDERKKAFEFNCRQLDLADRIGARCCVNTAGSRDPENWAGPHPDNLSEETFDMIVETTRSIIDEGQPTRTWFTLETMPWIFPESVDSYARIFKAIERDRFGVHFDPVNLVTSPTLYFNTGKMIREAFKKLGPYIKSCHAKDTFLRSELTTNIIEVQPGKGNLDYRAFLSELAKLQDVPLMLEHLEEAEQYDNAAAYIRNVATEMHLEI